MNIREPERWSTYSNYPSQIKREGSGGWEAVFSFLSLFFFSFWMQMVSEISAFDWHAVLQCFYFLFQSAFAREISDVFRCSLVCVFVCSNGCVVCMCFVWFHPWICAHFSRQMTNVWTIKCLQLSYHVFLSICPGFACVSMWHFYTRTLCLCVFEIWSHLPCNHHIHTLFLIITEPFILVEQHPSTFLFTAESDIGR